MASWWRWTSTDQVDLRYVRLGFEGPPEVRFDREEVVLEKEMEAYR
jgi:sRNA-binding carbon storage regulator CsrA